MIVAVTGHRPEKLGGHTPDAGGDRLQRWIRWCLRTRLRQLQAVHGVNLLGVSGMALGVDQWFAQECVDAGIPFIAAVPFVGQESRWPAASRRRYAELLARAERTEVVCEGGYAPWKMQRRNEWMVDRADLVLAVWNGSSGGTANCVRYAAARGKPVERIDPATFAELEAPAVSPEGTMTFRTPWIGPVRDEHLRMKGLRRVRGRDMLGLNDAPENAALCPIPVCAEPPQDRGLRGAFVLTDEGLHYLAPPPQEPTETVTVEAQVAREWVVEPPFTPAEWTEMVRAAVIERERRVHRDRLFAQVPLGSVWQFRGEAEGLAVAFDFAAAIRSHASDWEVRLVLQDGASFYGRPARPGEFFVEPLRWCLLHGEPRPDWTAPVWTPDTQANVCQREKAWDRGAGRYVRRVEGMEAPGGWEPATP